MRPRKEESLIEPERATSGVNKELDIFSRILGIQQEKLANNGVSDEVINTTSQEDDSLPEKKPHGVGLGASHGGGGGLRSGGE